MKIVKKEQNKQKVNKLVVNLYEKTKKREMLEIYNKFSEKGLILKPLTEKEIKQFKTTRDLLYAIARQNAKVTYTQWKSLIEINDVDLYKLCLEYPIFINRLDDNFKLIDVINIMTKEDIKKIMLARGVKIRIKGILKSYDRFLNNEKDVFKKF